MVEGSKQQLDLIHLCIAGHWELDTITLSPNSLTCLQSFGRWIGGKKNRLEFGLGASDCAALRRKSHHSEKASRSVQEAANCQQRPPRERFGNSLGTGERVGDGGYRGDVAVADVLGGTPGGICGFPCDCAASFGRYFWR